MLSGCLGVAEDAVAVADADAIDACRVPSSLCLNGEVVVLDELDGVSKTPMRCATLVGRAMLLLLFYSVHPNQCQLVYIGQLMFRQASSRRYLTVTNEANRRQ